MKVVERDKENKHHSQYNHKQHQSYYYRPCMVIVLQGMRLSIEENKQWATYQTEQSKQNENSKGEECKESICMDVRMSILKHFHQENSPNDKHEGSIWTFAQGDHVGSYRVCTIDLPNWKFEFEGQMW